MALQEESEMTDGGVNCQKLPVKSRVLGFGGGKLFGVKARQEYAAGRQHPRQSQTHQRQGKQGLPVQGELARERKP